MAEFNLIEEPWIPCIDLEGRNVEHSIRDTLLKAEQLREVCDDSPLVTVAIHRLLTAILYRAFEGPSNKRWKELYRTGSFASDSQILGYLANCYDHFFLFDEARPFMQVAGLDLNEYRDNGEVKKDKSDGLMRLVREAPDKSGRVLFDHRVGTERPQYEPKQIARMLLSAQSFSSTGVASGGKLGDKLIKPTPCQFAPCIEGFVLWFQGESLFHTLMLNLVPRDHVINDKPPWEDDSVVDAAIESWKNPISFTGPVQRFASLSRFIRIIDQQSMFFTNGLKTEADSEDPMKGYSRSDDKKDYQAVRLREDRAAWRDAHALFSVSSPTHKPPACLNHIARLIQEGVFAKTAQPRANVVGLATDQGKALLWRHERLPVPAVLLGNVDLIERLGGLIQHAEQAATELNSRTRRLAKLYLTPDCESPGGRQPERDEVTKMVKALDPRPAYWTWLEKHFFILLENLPHDWDEASENWKTDDQQTATRMWRDNIKREAQLALEESIRSIGTTARAIQAVARVRTDFNDGDTNPSLQTADKTKRKAKGGLKK
jgi:CRISPR system Cascade subunit CasA